MYNENCEQAALVEELKNKNAKLLDELRELEGNIKKLTIETSNLKAENAHQRKAIHEWMQTTDQGGTEEQLVKNFIGMYAGPRPKHGIMR